MPNRAWAGRSSAAGIPAGRPAKAAPAGPARCRGRRCGRRRVPRARSIEPTCFHPARRPPADRLRWRVRPTPPAKDPGRGGRQDRDAQPDRAPARTALAGYPPPAAQRARAAAPGPLRPRPTRRAAPAPRPKALRGAGPHRGPGAAPRDCRGGHPKRAADLGPVFRAGPFRRSLPPWSRCARWPKRWVHAPRWRARRHRARPALAPSVPGPRPWRGQNRDENSRPLRSWRDSPPNEPPRIKKGGAFAPPFAGHKGLARLGPPQGREGVFSAKYSWLSALSVARLGFEVARLLQEA